VSVEPGVTAAPPRGRARLLQALGLAAGDRGLARGVAGTLGLNVSTTVLNFAVAVVLARLLGADGYGAFSFGFAWAMVLSSVAGLGLSPLVVRHVASMHAVGDLPALRGLLRWSNRLVVATSLLISAVAGLCAWLFLDDEALLGPLLIGLALVLPTALVIVRQSAMQGLGQVVLGRVPETLVAPGLFLVLAAAVGLTWNDSFSASWAMALLVTATILAFAVGAGLLARALPQAVREVAPRYESRSWARSATPLVLLGLVGVLSAQAGTILLGVFADAEDTGVFALALRLSMFASFLFLASTYPLMPVVARLHALGDAEQMRRTVHRAARIIFLCSLPVGLAIIVFADPLLGLFGADFRTGTEAVRVLVLAELVKVFFGLSGLLLVMTGREADFARGVILGSVLNVGLSLVLIPAFSVGGAAVAAAVATAVTHLILTSLSRRRLGFSGAAWSIADVSRGRRRTPR
jgi:O-antigen/teichoic acid export membrane protein